MITGGGSGIGLATAGQLAAAGFRLIVVDIDGESATHVAGTAGIGIRADISEPNDVQSAMATALDTFGRIDVLINNAGITGSASATICHETPVSEWDRVFAVNSRGVFLCTRSALPTMLRQGSGHVITVASVAAAVAFPGRCAYTASKGAALQFTKSLAVDYASHGVRANAVCPGFVETPMTRWRLENEDLKAEVEARIPLGRVASPNEIADAISLLASGRLQYMNGQALVIDGGWTSL
jgi:NAD(P)-dependent dehydrogenase (short-subunit alcohol dehydrogenase family)